MAEETKYLAGMTEDQLKDLVRNIADGGTIRETRGITKVQLEAIYATGLDHYKAGDYENAKKVFCMLVMLEHTSSRFWTAFGGACQALGQYPNAIKCYQAASFFNLHNPKPMYYAAECFHLTGDRTNAMRALRSLEMFGPKDTEDGRRYRALGETLRAKVEAA